LFIKMGHAANLLKTTNMTRVMGQARQICQLRTALVPGRKKIDS